jgi:hypothetical protein
VTEDAEPTDTKKSMPIETVSSGVGTAVGAKVAHTSLVAQRLNPATNRRLEINIDSLSILPRSVR